MFSGTADHLAGKMKNCSKIRFFSLMAIPDKAQATRGLPKEQRKDNKEVTLKAHTGGN